MAKHAARDPMLPKQNLSPFMTYQNAMRESFRHLNPGMLSFGALTKYTTAMYAEMPPEEKEGWAARAEADTARYLAEFEQYKPSAGYDTNGDLIVEQDVGAEAVQAPPPGGPRRVSAKKDENAPKRNVSAYLLYQNAMREQFKQDNPGMTFGNLSKYTSHMYNHLTKTEKAVWEARAAEDKARYEDEISKYHPPPGCDARGKPKGRKSKRASVPKDPAAPKRASGAYIFFMQEMRPQLSSEFPRIGFVESGKIMGERWRNLDPEEKKRYGDMAAKDKVRFVKENAAYNAKKDLAQQQADIAPLRHDTATADHLYQQNLEPHAADPPQHTAGVHDPNANVYPQY